MDIIIQSLGFTAGDGLENFIQEKLSKLINKDRIVRANVTLYRGSDANPNNNYCEIRLEAPGNDPFVKKSSDTFEKAITEAVEVLQNNLRKAKEKQLDRQHGGDIDDQLIG
jgi:putative sigma-54 modulation protein